MNRSLKAAHEAPDKGSSNSRKKLTSMKGQAQAAAVTPLEKERYITGKDRQQIWRDSS